MEKSLNWRIPLVLIVIILAVIAFYPPAKKISLGLDLKGGMHLTLQVLTDEALAVQTDMQVDQLRSSLKENSIKYEKVIRKDYHTIEISGTLPENERDLRTAVLDKSFQDWTYYFSGPVLVMKLKENIERTLRDQAVLQALETVRNRVDELGVSEPTIQRERNDKILVELPGIDNPGRVKSLIKSTAMLEFRAVAAGPFATREEALKNYNGVLPDDLELLPTNPRRLQEGIYAMPKAAVVSGTDLRKSRRAQDDYGYPAVGFTLDSQGAKKIEKFSSANIGKLMAIVLDDRIESVATIEGTLGFESIIKGRFTYEEVDDMVLVLNSGALPAPMRYLEEQTIGPSLGADSIRKGILASVGGLVLVIGFMLVYYKAAGLNSVLALILNMVILMGGLAMIKATLTVPGIAGIILSIGMAVDANVLIFERIREELGLGKAPKSAIEAGFKKAFRVIADSNLTTIIAAVFLFSVGSGPIRGFAITLIIGIMASMFTAVFVSRVLFDLTYGRQKSIKKLSI